MENDKYKLGSLLFLGSCIVAVWIIAYSVPPKIESFNTGFTLSYSKKSDMQTQTDEEDPPFPSSFETVEMVCNHGECTRTNESPDEVDNELVPEQSLLITEAKQRREEYHSEHTDEKMESPIVRKITNFQQEPEELFASDPIILGVNRKRIVMADPFNIEKNLKK